MPAEEDETGESSEIGLLWSLLFIPVLFLGAALAVGQASRDLAAQLPSQSSRNGTIVLGGGYFDSKESTDLLRRVTELAGGGTVSLVIIPTADPQLEPAKRTGPTTTLIDYETAARLSFARLGVRHVTVLHTRNRRFADSDEFAKPLRSASCVWIPGGDPELLFEVYSNTTVQKELQALLDRGGIIAGDSAGALLIGQGLLAVDLRKPARTPTARQNGLDLLRNAFVMPHVNRYKPGIVELGCRKFVSVHPDKMAILIEENTAVVIQHDRMARLIGNGRAGVIDGGSHSTASVVWLVDRQTYDLQSHSLVQ